MYSRKTLTRQSISSYTKRYAQNEYGPIANPRVNVCNLKLNKNNTSSMSQLQRSTNSDEYSAINPQSFDLESKTQIKHNKCTFKSVKKAPEFPEQPKKNCKQAKIISLNKGAFISKISDAISKHKIFSGGGFNKRLSKNSEHKRMLSAHTGTPSTKLSKTRISGISTRDSIRDTQIQLEKLKKYVSRQLSPNKDITSGDQTIESSHLNQSEYKASVDESRRDVKDVITKLVEKESKLIKQYNRSDYVDTQSVIFDMRKATHKFIKSHPGFQVKQIVKKNNGKQVIKEYREPSKVSIFPPRNMEKFS